MIKADNLRKFHPGVRIKNGSGITLSAVQTAVEKGAEDIGIPVAFYDDQVKSGGLFNSSVEDCIVMYHPDHERDYFKFCIRAGRQGSYAFVSVNNFGESKQIAKANYAESAYAERQGKSLGHKIGSMIDEGIMTIGKNKQKLEEEQMYYQCIRDIFDEIF